MNHLPEVRLVDGHPAQVYCRVHSPDPAALQPAYAVCSHVLRGDRAAFHSEPYPNFPGALVCSGCRLLYESNSPALIGQAEEYAHLGCARCLASQIAAAAHLTPANPGAASRGGIARPRVYTDGLDPELHQLAFAHALGYEAVGQRRPSTAIPFEDSLLRWGWKLGFRCRVREIEGQGGRR